MAIAAHPAQLLICHQKIETPFRHPRMRGERSYQWCNLRAAAWCYDCSYYVCEVHGASRHAIHEVVPEA